MNSPHMGQKLIWATRVTPSLLRSGVGTFVAMNSAGVYEVPYLIRTSYGLA